MEDIKKPKSSAGEITIVTPENKIYTEPDSGYYPATYGFENDINRSPPEGWDVNMSSGTTVVVQNYYSGHNKVVDIYDDSIASYPSMWKFFSEQPSSGTIEFWILSTDSSKYTWVDFGIILKFGIDNGNFRTYNGSWHDLTTCSNNTWYRIRLDFETTTNGYQGLMQNQYHFYINDILYDNYGMQDTDYIYIMILKTEWGESGYHSYFDAIGFSWDPNYNVGDNSKEGLLLNYENTTNLEWKGYSLDGQANRTILGNTTIPMPTDGLHSIEVYGNNSMGMMYESNLRYFSVDTTQYINIITPENTIYTEPDSGYFPATYGFENDVNGSFPEGWLVNITSTTSVVVQNSHGAHTKVLHFNDDSDTSYPSMSKFISQQPSSGTIEFWILTTDSSKITRVDFWGPSAIFLKLVVDNSNFRAYDITWRNLTTCNNDTWYRIRLDFETTTNGYQGLLQNQYHLYINDTLYGLYGNYSMPDTDYLYIMNFKTYKWDSGYHTYIDAIGFSWDLGYNVGDNSKEGLLLSYENTTNLEWKGYSLDGQANKTILGNHTIPVPDNGTHSIQVFGNDSIGTKYQSPIRNFAINYWDDQPLSLNIVYPSQDEVFGYNSPDFLISGTGINASWYSLDYGATNFTFTGLSGTIDSFEWSKFGEGMTVIRFYAEDTVGNQVLAEVQVEKDLTAPLITIDQPEIGDIFIDFPPIYSISIDELRSYEFWYSLDNGAHNYTITELVGPISQASWDVIPDGHVTLRFYAEDEVGNIGQMSVLITKYTTEPPESPPPGIPGYDLYLLLGALSVISAILIRKRMKS